MKRLVMSVFIMFFLILPLAFAQETNTVTVAAAANLATVAEPLRAAFSAKYPRANIDFVFGASGALTTQIQNGAPFHVFLSADVDFPTRLFDAGLTAGSPKVYATGKVIILSVRPLDFGKGLEVLTDPAIVQFALANPTIAPYGKAGEESLVKAGLWDAVKSKVVTAQSITQALQYTLGATGVGFVNKSALYTNELASYRGKQGLHWFEVDDSWHSPIDQAFVVLKSAASNPTAQAFATFLSSPEAQSVFVKAGYAVP